MERLPWRQREQVPLKHWWTIYQTTWHSIPNAIIYFHKNLKSDGIHVTRNVRQMTRTTPSEYKTSEDMNISYNKFKQFLFLFATVTVWTEWGADSTKLGITNTCMMPLPVSCWTAQCSTMMVNHISSCIPAHATDRTNELDSRQWCWWFPLSILSRTTHGLQPKFSSSVYQHMTTATHFLLAHKSHYEKKGSS